MGQRLAHSRGNDHTGARSTEKKAASLDSASLSVAVEGDPKSPTNTHGDGAGTFEGRFLDPVEAALAKALDAAAVAGRFDVVGQIAKELEARRLARTSNVVPIKRGAR